MKRVAFTLIGGSTWTGGVQYLQNLLSAISNHCRDRIAPFLFVGDDVGMDDIGTLAAISGVTLVRSPAFSARRRELRLLQAFLVGRDQGAAREFDLHKIDAVFEAAQFFGSRIEQSAFAWIPDFQHRYLPHLFSPMARFKREIGFRAQMRSGRTIVLSSEDGRRDCEQFHPSTVGKTRVVRFSVPAPEPVTSEVAYEISRQYGLPEKFFFLPNQFWQHKNHSRVVEALALLGQRGRTDVVVAASGRQLDPRNAAHYPNLEQRIAATGVAAQLKLLGMIPRDHLAALMQSCVALLNPSLFEGWSTTVEEAKALGVPMLLSDLSVHREQAGTEASYFDRLSASSLADALEGFRPLTATEREQRASQARAASTARVREFANTFANVIESAGPPCAKT